MLPHRSADDRKKHLRKLLSRSLRKYATVLRKFDMTLVGIQAFALSSSNLRVAFVFTLFTFCPPGPDDLLNVMTALSRNLGDDAGGRLESQLRSTPDSATDRRLRVEVVAVEVDCRRIREKSI